MPRIDHIKLAFPNKAKLAVPVKWTIRELKDADLYWTTNWQERGFLGKVVEINLDHPVQPKELRHIEEWLKNNCKAEVTFDYCHSCEHRMK